MTETTGPDKGLPSHFLRRQEAADRAGVHWRTIDRWREENRLTTYRRRRDVFIDARELDSLMRIVPS